MNEALTTEDPTNIKEAIERLKNSSMEIGKAIYSQNDGASSEQQEEPAAEAEEEKKEEEKKEEEKK